MIRISFMSQPVWKFLTNLGDVNPAQHGGFFVFTDETGVYGPEVEVYEPSERKMYRIMLETGDEWFMDKLDSVAVSCGQSVERYREDLASNDPVRIATVYRDLTLHFGCFEFDQYPVRLSEHEAEVRYEAYKK